MSREEQRCDATHQSVATSGAASHTMLISDK
jgi:hypothetical protein